MTGSLIDLSKQGDVSVGDDEAYASLGYSGTLALDICHGLDLGIEGTALAEAGVSQHLLDYLHAAVEIEAGVEAGVRLTARASPDVLDDIGLAAVVKAYLKAYIQGSLELSLTMDAILSAVRHRADPTTYRIFEDFAGRLEVGAGVQAKAQVALTAAAEVVCQGRMAADESKDEKAGFDVRVNAEAAFLFGFGVDFFAMARLNDLDDFFRNTKDVLLAEIRAEAEAKADLPPRAFDLIFRSWSSAIDLIIDGSLGAPDARADALVVHLRDFITGFLLEEFNNAYDNLLDHLFELAAAELERRTDLDSDQLDTLSLALQDLQTALPSVNAFHDLLPLLDNINTIHWVLGLPEADRVQETITHVYVLGYLLDEPNRTHYEDLPSYAQVRYRAATGQSLASLSDPGQAYLYLENGCFADWLREFCGLDNGPVGELLDLLHNQGLSLAGCLQLVLDDDPANHQPLLKLGLDLLEGLFAKHSVPAIETHIRPVLAQTELGENYYECVLDNTLHSFPTLFTGLLRAYVNDPGDKDKIERMRYLCNRYLVILFGKNAAFFTGQLLEFSADNLSHSVRTANQYIRHGRFRFMAEDLFDEIEERIEQIVPYPVEVEIEREMMNDLIEATEEFLLDILSAADRAMGRQTWTDARIGKLTRAIEGLLVNPDDNEVDFQSTLDSSAVQQLIDRIGECSFLPAANLDSLDELSEVLAAVGLTQFKEFVLTVPWDTAVYFVKLLKILLVELLEEILEFLEDLVDGIREGLEDALAALESLIEDLEAAVEALLEDIEKLIEDLYDDTVQAIEDLFEGLVDELDFEDLSWLEDFLQWLGELFGGDSDQEKARKAVRALKRQAMNNMHRIDFEGRVRRRVLNGQSTPADFHQWLNDHVLTQDIYDQLDKMSFRRTDSVLRNLDTAFGPVRQRSTDIDDKARDHRANSGRLRRSREERRDAQLKLQTLRARDAMLQDLGLSRIRINSPLLVNLQEGDLPLYGEHVYLDIDFDRVDIRRVIRDQLAIAPEDLQDPANGKLDNALLKNDIAYNRDRDELHEVAPLHLKILVNGQEIPLREVEARGSRLSLHLGRPLIKQGLNDLYVVLAAPPGRAVESFVAHRQFLCDDDRRKRPGNTVYIDPQASVIDTRGDDHLDARRAGVDDKEKVVIRNAGDQPVEIGGWSLSDARGHRYTFDARIRIKPRDSLTLLVGRGTAGRDGWIGRYHGRVIALLNNEGEFLKLEDGEGKVVSQLYTGNPEVNDDIHVYRGSAQ